MEELAKQIAGLLQTLNSGAKGVGESVQRIAPDAWRVVVKQVIVDAWSSIVCWTIVSLVIFGIAIFLRRCANASTKKVNESEDDHKCQYMKDLKSEAFTMNAWALVLTVAGSVVLFSAFNQNVPRLLNAEYHAASYLSERLLGR